MFVVLKRPPILYSELAGTLQQFHLIIA